jgi:hypothetical protein
MRCSTRKAASRHFTQDVAPPLHLCRWEPVFVSFHPRNSFVKDNQIKAATGRQREVHTMKAVGSRCVCRHKQTVDHADQSNYQKEHLALVSALHRVGLSNFSSSFFRMQISSFFSSSKLFESINGADVSSRHPGHGADEISISVRSKWQFFFF